MSTKYIESEARVMSLVLIEGIAEMKRLEKATKCRIIVSRSNVLRKRILNGRHNDAKRARTKDYLCPGNSEQARILRVERTGWQISGNWWVQVRTGGRWASKERKLRKLDDNT